LFRDGQRLNLSEGGEFVDREDACGETY